MDQKGFVKILLVLIFIMIPAGAVSCLISVQKSGSAAPHIHSLTPDSGSVGTIVTIKGYDFSPSYNIVKFGLGYTRYLSSPDGFSLEFSVPSFQDECHPSGYPCYEKRNFPVTPGEYSVTVSNPNGTSNTVIFVVR